MIIGQKETLAFVIGEKVPPKLQIVDIFLANKQLTYFDNSAHVPSFAYSLQCEADDIESGKVDEDHIYFNFGPTTDDVFLRGQMADGNIKFNCELRTGEKFSATISASEVVSVLRSAAEKLRELHA